MPSDNIPKSRTNGVKRASIYLNTRLNKAENYYQLNERELTASLCTGCINSNDYLNS